MDSPRPKKLLPSDGAASQRDSADENVLAVASIIMFLLGVLAVVSVSRQQAVAEARRAEASRLVALGRLEMERYPTATLAYARKSLEVADNAEARRLALESLWQGTDGSDSPAWEQPLLARRFQS